MKTLFAAFCSICILVSGCKKQEELPVPEAPNAQAPTNSGYLSSAGRAMQSMEKTVDTASLNNAVQLFGAQEGRLPKDLNELVEKKYLSKLPVPPFGSKLQYDQAQGKVSIVKE